MWGCNAGPVQMLASCDCSTHRSVRTLTTERPYTPAENTRKLFGFVGGGGSSRPPSVFR